MATVQSTERAEDFDEVQLRKLGMSRIRIFLNSFDGIIPSLAPKLLPDTAAQTAENIYLTPKRMDPWKVPLDVQATPSGNVSIYPWRRNSTTEWLSWTVDTDVVQSPVAEDAYERIYLTDGVKPQVIGWSGGAKVQKDMEQPTATAPTATSASGGVLATVLDLFKAATATLTGSLSAYGTTSAIPATLSGTPYKVSMSADQTEIYLDFSSLTLGGGANGVAIYEPDPPGASSYASTSIAISIPVPGYGTLTGSGSLSLGALGSVVISGSTLDTILKIDTGTVAHSWSINPATVGVGERHFFWAHWTTLPSSVRITIKVTYATGTELALEATKYCYYVQTLVNEWGMEGPASPVSNEVTWESGQKITLSAMGAASGSTKRRFYRSAAGTSEDHFYYVDEMAVGGAGDTYEDTKTDAELGEELPLFENPPDNLKAIVMSPNGFAAAFRGREVCFSEPWYPWSWPTEYRLTVDYDIIGLAVSGNDVYVLTKGTPYLITGYHPESLQMSRIAAPQSCVSKRSIAPLGPMICYASPDGLMGLVGGQARLLTEKFYDRAEWQALTPSGMISAVHDGQYFGFCVGGGLIFRFSEGADTCTTTDQTITAIHYDLLDDTLYIVDGGTIKSWNRGTTNMTMLWRSKEFPFPRRQNWNCGRIVADGYPLTFRIYAENVLVSTISVISETSFRIPILRQERTWSLEVESTYGVDLVAVATSMSELGVNY